MKSEKSSNGVRRRLLRCRFATPEFFITHLSFFIFFACSSPKIIPDEELANIFHDIYLTNAYAAQRPSLRLDSLNTYEPVFASYGYTTEDMQYTIGSFAKRKSARLSDIVDAAITRLGEESRFYRYRIFVQDTVSSFAREKYSRVVYSDSLIRVSRVRDTSRLRIVIPVTTGTYDVAYEYFLDSLDLNELPRVEHYLLDTLNRRTGSGGRRLQQMSREEVTASLSSDERHKELVLNLNGYKEKMKKPDLTIENLVVKYYLPDSVSLARLTADMLRLPLVDSIMAPMDRRPPLKWPVPEEFIKAHEAARKAAEAEIANDAPSPTETR